LQPRIWELARERRPVGIHEIPKLDRPLHLHPILANGVTEEPPSPCQPTRRTPVRDRLWRHTPCGPVQPSHGASRSPATRPGAKDRSRMPEKRASVRTCAHLHTSAITRICPPTRTAALGS
jgi:hypothetical protein